MLAPEHTFVVDPARLHHKQPLTAFAGRTLHGVVQQTWLHGELVDDDTRGRLLTRDPA